LNDFTLEQVKELYAVHTQATHQKFTHHALQRIFELTCGQPLLFMAWLQRIVNSGEHMSREYAAGLGRLDLCLEFAGERFAFELKLSGSIERG
jgi:hypothetical protein